MKSFRLSAGRLNVSSIDNDEGNTMRPILEGVDSVISAKEDYQSSGRNKVNTVVGIVALFGFASLGMKAVYTEQESLGCALTEEIGMLIDGSPSEADLDVAFSTAVVLEVAANEGLLDAGTNIDQELLDVGDPLFIASLGEPIGMPIGFRDTARLHALQDARREYPRLHAAACD